MRLGLRVEDGGGAFYGGANQPVLARAMRLTLLAPGIVARIADGSSREAISLDRVIKPFSEMWHAQQF